MDTRERGDGSSNKTADRGGGTTMADSITIEELKARIQGDRPPVVFDVRKKDVFEAAPEKIKGATWLDPAKADEWSDQIPTDRPVVFYCAKGGSVSQSITDRIQQTNPEVKFLQGGIAAWKESGEPVGE